MFVWWNLLFPWLDAAYTVFFLPGVVLALFGVYWIAGPMTLVLLPMALLMNYLMFHIGVGMFIRQAAARDLYHRRASSGGRPGRDAGRDRATDRLHVLGRSVEQKLTERVTVIVLAGYQPFTDGNDRAHFRARLVWDALPDDGINLQARWRQYHNSKMDVGGAHFDPESYQQWLGLVGFRKRHSGWTTSGAVGAGQEYIRDGRRTCPAGMIDRGRKVSVDGAPAGTRQFHRVIAPDVARLPVTRRARSVRPRGPCGRGPPVSGPASFP